jgi:hypothetical protein
MRRAAVVVLALVVALVVCPAPATAVSITNVVFTPPSPAHLDFGSFDGLTLVGGIVNFTFDYQLDVGQGIAHVDQVRFRSSRPTWSQCCARSSSTWTSPSAARRQCPNPPAWS